MVEKELASSPWLSSSALLPTGKCFSFVVHLLALLIIVGLICHPVLGGGAVWVGTATVGVEEKDVEPQPLLEKAAGIPKIGGQGYLSSAMLRLANMKSKLKWGVVATKKYI